MEDRDQPHDHRVSDPTEPTTTSSISASGNSTASSSSQAFTVNFPAWQNGEEIWLVMTRPDLCLAVDPAPRVAVSADEDSSDVSG
jgi:hypothetical protein